MAAGDPTGSALASKTINISGNGVVNFPFDTPYTLENGKQYCIVVSSTGFDVNNCLQWVQYVGDGYAGGLRLYSTDSGSSWAQASTRDMNFTLWSGAEQKDNFSGSGSVLKVYGTIYIGQSLTTTSSYSVTQFSSSFSTVGTPNGTITAGIYKVEGETYTDPATKATNPIPSNADTNVTLDQATITWEDGGGADTFDVYYGTESGNLTKVSSAQAGLSFTITGITDGSPYNYLSTRYWRIDSTNVTGTTTGDEWSFTTIRLKVPTVTYFYPTGGYYYQLLIQEGGTYGNPPPGGVENTDYVIVTYEPNFISTVRKLVSAANNKIWYEDI